MRLKGRSSGHDIVVVGASAGGLDALDTLIGELPADLAASIFVVQHMASEDSSGALTRRLKRHKAFDVKVAEEGDRIALRRVYVAPADNHLLLKATKVLVRKGARENRNRPSIDPLFRSAAVAYGSRVIGVVLTGMLDDGTAGLLAIKQCGGITMVQDPKDAAYPDMPQSALDNLRVDFCVPLADMGQLLARLVAQRPGPTTRVPADVRTEALIAERVCSDVDQVDGLGSQVPYNCPNCGGVLWEMSASKAKRYRCHTGHSFTAAALLASQSEKIEEMLWISLRMFEERKHLLKNMGKAGHRRRRSTHGQRLGQTQGYIDRLRGMLVTPESQGADDNVIRVKALMAEPPRAKSAR